MKEKPLISVIIPIYMVEDYVEECIASVCAQTYRNIEIILVDDGSKDNCGKICDQYAQQDERIVVIHKQNGGLSNARNAGVRNATGKYILFVDGDDSILATCVEKLYKLVDEYNAQVAGTTISWKKENGLFFGSGMDYIKRMFQNRSGWSACGKLIESKLVKELAFPDGLIYEDLYWTPLLLENVQKIVITSEVFYEYHVRSDSIMADSKKVLKSDLVTIADLAIQHFKEKEEKNPTFFSLVFNFYVWHVYQEIVCLREYLKDNSSYLVALKNFMKKYCSEIRKYKVATVKEQLGFWMIVNMPKLWKQIY